MLSIRLKYSLLGKLIKYSASREIMIRNSVVFSRLVIGLFLPLVPNYSIAQNLEKADSIRQLGEVIIQAYNYNRPLIQTPASVGVVGSRELQRFNESTLVPSFNTVPGVRFEERSPGSYRLSVRGSTIRSPFGVRNVKVYWNGMPLTDPGGNTYLNQLDPGMMGNMEILKGPGSSIYGAGTGGVLLLNSPVIAEGHVVNAGVQRGSFGGELFQVGYEEAQTNSSHQVQVLHQQSDGYRDQTRMSRDVVNGVFHFDVNDNQVLETYIFYSDLFYETPGGLTLTEFTANPRQARPATALFPGAVQQQARVHLQSFYMGVSHEYYFNQHLHNRTSVYGNLVKFENAAIRNFDHRNEQSFGGRSVTTFSKPLGSIQLTMLGGGEFQLGFLPTKSYQNVNGKEGALLADDEATVFLLSLFGQGEVKWKRLSATAGLSYNAQRIIFQRLSDVGSPSEELTYTPEVMPRLAVLLRAHENISVIASVSKGFSPPTLAEINASNGIFNRDLEPETGINYEAGVRANFFDKTLKTELTAYVFRLNETIVIRRDEDGAEYFVNAGNTNQKGIEWLVGYRPKMRAGNFFNAVDTWLSYTYNHYRFGDYSKGQDDFSGNELTGTPKYVLSGGVDISVAPGLYLRGTCSYTAKLPLNDANTVYAESYLLPGLRAGYRHKRFEVYVGGENLLDEHYSLGNDLNAAGGRYYNAAFGRNFYGGLKINVAF
jgi:iron complex outermembrane recepter protein